MHLSETDLKMSKGIQRIFSEAARTYEMINHLLTFGLDILLRKKATEVVPIKQGAVWLDVCSGTGEMAVALRNVANEDTRILSSDITLDMLREAKAKPEFDDIAQALANAGSLPFSDDTFDLVTISYATRNLNPTRARLTSYLREFRRVLKPGGLFINLETSQPSSPLIRTLYHRYVRIAVRRLGQLISGSKAGYAYLSHTVPRFYGAMEFARVIQLAGFDAVRYQTYFLGIFAVHMATAI